VGANNVDTMGGLTIFGAVEKVGLKLESKKVTLPVMIVEHAEKPAGN
jgi:uncharacterized protein (TIGR03435 family)